MAFDPANILSALMAKGYFPKELPLPFTTTDFGRDVWEILGEWEAQKVYQIDAKSAGKIAGKSKSGSYLYDVPFAELEVMSKPKRGYERRDIHITHPVPQALLARELCENWPAVQKWLSRRRYSEDEIAISSAYDRSVKGINFPMHRAKKSYLTATSDWVVKTDITRFYPSIYTHSIAWAAYGKEAVKAGLKKYKGSLADRLDILVRATNRNQTVGIPIGPETSRIIAEVISARIDDDFSIKNPSLERSSIDRLQDDWLIGVSSLEKAEHALSSISSIYRSYNLEINGSKTAIERLIAQSEDRWLSEINSFLSHGSSSLSGSRLREFLTLCLRLQTENMNEPVMNYALAVIEAKRYSSTDVELLESFLLKAAVISPISLASICRIILNFEVKSGSVSKTRIRDRFTILAERSLEKGHHFEVIWLLYTLRGLKTQLVSKRISEMILETQSSAIALLLLDMKEKGLCKCSLPIGKWEGEISEDRILGDWSWLRTYEGIRHGWLSEKNNLKAHPFFKPMFDRDIVFYDPKKNIETSKKVRKVRSLNRLEDKKAVWDFIKLIRGPNIHGGLSDY